MLFNTPQACTSHAACEPGGNLTKIKVIPPPASRNSLPDT